MTTTFRGGRIPVSTAGFAPVSHTHTASSVTDWDASVEATMAVKLLAGSNVTLTHNSGAGTFTIGASGGGSANVGTSTIDFGAFPGSTDTSVAVTGQGSILSGSSVNARIRLSPTADHSADEHFVEEMDVFAGNVVAGTGFTIYARTRNKRLFGTWSVAWQWS